MEEEQDWKLFESTGAVGAYLRYKAHFAARQQVREESEGQDGPADNNGGGVARHQDGRG